MNLKQLPREKKIGSRSRISANEFKNKKIISDVAYLMYTAYKIQVYSHVKELNFRLLILMKETSYQLDFG